MSLTILYFASLREALGTASETLEAGALPATLGALREQLVARGGDWTVLAGRSVRAAVNQEIAFPDTPLAAGDEIAFFPPVTGG